MSDQHLTRQDEDLSSSEFEGEERRDDHNFGSWPELAGLAFTLVVSWLILTIRG